MSDEAEVGPPTHEPTTEPTQEPPVLEPATPPAPVAPPEPSEPAVPPPAIPGPAPMRLPGTRAVVGAALELALRSSVPLRSASVAIGFQLLATVGPLVLLLLVLADRAPDLFDTFASGAAERTPTAQQSELAFAMLVAGTIAGLALVALSVESRILGAALLGSRAGGRPMRPLEALRRSRQVFWRVIGATFLVQIPLNIVSGVVSTSVEAMTGPSEASLILSTIVTMLASVPFAYVLTGIVLGGASIGVAIRRSIAMARVRWRIALVVAIAETLTQTLLILGLLAALDIVARIADVLGLGLDSGTLTTYLTLVVAMLVVAAIGSLLFTVSALAVAPQVVAFVGLTGYTGGLDGAREGPTTRRVRWVSIPMGIGAAVAILASISGISSILRG